MDKEQVIALARESGWSQVPTVRLAFAGFNLERFAALVAAHEREACAELCDSIHARHTENFGDYFGDNSYATECAAAIRARGIHEA